MTVDNNKNSLAWILFRIKIYAFKNPFPIFHVHIYNYQLVFCVIFFLINNKISKYLVEHKKVIWNQSAYMIVYHLETDTVLVQIVWSSIRNTQTIKTMHIVSKYKKEIY